MTPYAARPFPTEFLVLPTFVILIVGLAVSVPVTRSAPLALIIALIKSAAFFFYYGFFFDGTFTFLDDWSYLQGGAEILSWAWNWAAFEDNVVALNALAGGQHTLYYAFNAAALKLLGQGYFAPVALNIVVSTFTAALGAVLAGRQFPQISAYRAAFFAFLALHPSIFAWSIIMNGKDQVILFLHVVLLWAGSKILEGAPQSRSRAILVALAASLVLLLLRFYVPVLFALALVLTAAWTRTRAGGFRRVATAAGLLFLIVAVVGPAHFDYALSQVRENFVNPLFGFMRFVLTPVPFGTDPAYGFLDLPATLHWLLLPVVMIGLHRVLITANPFARFFVAYVAIFSFLYAVFGELQGPRHRLQLEYAVALLQFLGALEVLRVSARHLTSRSRNTLLQG